MMANREKKLVKLQDQIRHDIVTFYRCSAICISTYVPNRLCSLTEITENFAKAI